MTNFIPERPSTILVAMSGGVDSAVAAAMLAERGHTVIGAARHTDGRLAQARHASGVDSGPRLRDRPDRRADLVEGEAEPEADQRARLGEPPMPELLLPQV